MSTSRFLTRSPVLTFLLALAACGGGGDSGPPPPERPTLRTLTYVVTTCHEDAHSASASQRLLVVRGDGAPIMVAEIPTFGRLPALGLCPLYGAFSDGLYAAFAFGFQRFAVSPDGSGVVFEVNFEFSILATLGVRDPLTPEQEGIFFVRADGTGLRRLGPPSHERAQQLGGIPSADNPFPPVFLDLFFSFSPNGRVVAFTDRGPGPAGQDAAQVFVLDLATGKRTQVTQLPDVPPDPDNPVAPAITSVTFKDDATILFSSRVNSDGDQGSFDFSVRTDTRTLTQRPPPVVLPGSRVVPVFSITQPISNIDVFVRRIRGTPMNPSPFFPPDIFSEIFVLSSDHALQLTNFRRSDTTAGVSDGRRVFFIASADPLDTNPSENCQIFSIEPLGADLRQLTSFRAADHSAVGCIVAAPQQPGCIISYLYVDPETRTLIFPSNCDPLGTNPNGAQLFVMNIDGTGLRQLTATRGLETAADGSVDVELAGGFYYQPSF